MEKKDYIRENLEDIYNWIAAFVTEYTNLLIDLKNSYYYQRRGLRERMLSLLVEKKEFLKLYIECVNWNTFTKLHERYGKPEPIDEEFGLSIGIEKTNSKKIKRKKISVPVEDPRLIDIKKIYLADYPEVLGKYDAIPFMLERHKYYAQYKKSEPNLDSPVRQSGVHALEHRGSRTIDDGSPSPPANQEANEQLSPPSQKLKSSLVSNGLSVLNSP